MTSHSILAEVAPFADVPVEVVIELDRRMMRLRDILDLSVGSIIPMTKSAGDYLDLYVAGAPVCRGEVVALEKHAGVRITGFEPRT